MLIFIDCNSQCLSCRDNSQCDLCSGIERDIA